MTTTNTTSRVGGIREARVRAGLTQAQLASAAQCSLAFVGQIEAGAIPRQSNVLPRIQRVLSNALNDVEPAGNRLEVTTAADGARADVCAGY